ncbi:Sugar (pentulose or hexulose) kinase [Micromonospora rhizosphaerae]|uniref:Sugar (Pentulose or hexulose) kinase n=1 Tax=Micromonospora rhizosphaerae TaxID=568872 RepID=A0A1C6SY96_9ACTN|nr:FGGY family carbohydrate kinase [Micromonospora rhizosphaerae]SCL34292.1 Sugar (pentulose or hexulose) kinase [Micromonospora rhizosphaerae]
MSGLLVGIDVGTTRVKAVAVDPRGQVCGESERVTPWRRAGGRAEVDPMALVGLTRTVAAEVAGERGALGIGVTGMAETGVLVDGHDRPLAPAIAWYDPRGDVETIARELGEETFETTTGLPLTVLPSLAKLLWLRRNHPETAAAVRFYSVGEWIVRRFGGEPVAELSLASRTGLLELSRARPWEDAFGLLGSPLLLPEPVVAGTVAGRATGDDLPEALRGAALTVAGHDHQVAAYGVGAALDGALFDSLGTAEALVRTVRPPLAPRQVAALTGQGMSVGWGVVAGHLCVLAGLWTGLTLHRVAELLGATTTAHRRALGEQALAAPACHPTLRLASEGDGHLSVVGITDGVTPAILWRTAVEAMVAESGRLLDRIDALTGPHREVVVGGGWLHNPALLDAKRRQHPGMRTTAIAEPGAYGAALLAASAAGVAVPAPRQREVTQHVHQP